MNKCECPTLGLYSFSGHEPNECKNDYKLRLYQRGDKQLWLCSLCHFSGDKLVEETKETE